ncbi:MAG: FKBP-type peptidyl-prolyl cis-trans isomerase [Actinomycetota bacterium]
MRKALMCLVLLFAACSPDQESDVDAFATETPSEAAGPQAPDATPEITTDPDAALTEEDDLSTKPTIEVPDDDPPSGLVITNIVDGDGKEAPPGATVTIHYTGVSWSTGEEFDSSWEGEPATFPLGNLIPGWQQGIPGMKVGGRRQLIIPPVLGYGEAGSPPVIAPNETLVFVIDLIDVAS